MRTHAEGKQQKHRSTRPGDAAGKEPAAKQKDGARPGPLRLWAWAAGAARPGAAAGGGAPAGPGRDVAGLPVFTPAPVRVQAKARVSTPGDAWEREADDVATAVTRPDAAAVSGPPPREAGSAAVPAGAASLVRGAGAPLPPSTRSFFEARLGHGLGGVRVHDDPAADRSARALGAIAYTVGSHVAFARGRYRPGTPQGRTLLAHELAHVVQQAGPARGGPAVMRQVPPASVQALEAQLAARRVERAELQRRIDASQDRFVGETADERSAGALQADDPRMQGVRQDVVPPSARDMLRRAVTVVQRGDTYVLQTRFELSFLALAGTAAAQRAQAEIPRLVQAIRDEWTVAMPEGRYAGRRFTLEPVITHREAAQARNPDTLQIMVRGDDPDPSSGTWWNGEISLASAHLSGDRIRVVGHEVYHLFGFLDAYFSYTPDPVPGSTAAPRPRWAVGRGDPAGRPDLLGLVDPEVLRRKLAAGEITQADFDLQTRAATVWAEDAEAILYALGVPPIPEAQRPLPDPDSEGYEEAVERRMEAIRAAGEREIAEIRRRRARAEESMQWLSMVERVMALDTEIAALQTRIRQLRGP
ncbi:MAG TPA: DUF4157 domain-containing protein [Longimicrobiaceae bacterium]